MGFRVEGLGLIKYEGLGFGVDKINIEFREWGVQLGKLEDWCGEERQLSGREILATSGPILHWIQSN